MGGKACIRGMRVTVGMVVNQIGIGHSIDEILADYSYLEREDVMQAPALRAYPRCDCRSQPGLTVAMLGRRPIHAKAARKLRHT
jgi:Protein of unknown function (DUF433)